MKRTGMPSPRQELAAFAGSGQLRDALERYGLMRMSPKALQLAVDVVIRYCEPRRKRRSK